MYLFYLNQLPRLNFNILNCRRIESFYHKICPFHNLNLVYVYEKFYKFLETKKRFLRKCKEFLTDVIVSRDPCV